MTCHNPDRAMFVMNSYDGKDHSGLSLTLDEVLAVKRERYDHFLDLSRDFLAFRDANAHWRTRNLSDTRLGKTPLDVLFAMQLNAGQCVDCLDLVELTGNEYLLAPGNVSRHLVLLRRVHAEHWSQPWFFRTRRRRPFAVMWPAERSWIRIERINPDLQRST